MNILERIPELACTICKKPLDANADGSLHCSGCNKTYQTQNGFINMLTDGMQRFAEEIAVQDSVAVEYEQKRYQKPYARRYHNWWTEQMAKRVKSEGRFLDNGCGTGLLFENLHNSKIVGLDISSEMLKYARQHCNELVLGNSQQLPFVNDCFDVVFCRSLIHHLPKPQLAIDEISRVLKVGGEAVFVDTNCSLLSALPRMIANKGEHFSEDHKNLTRKEMTKLLEPNFKIDEIMYFGYIAYPLLGFPDIVNIFEHIPFKSAIEPTLMFIDNVISRIPLLRTQSWAILVKATNRG
ncbi:MAG: class I SAM-dependent methyltransferase [Planctomycetes bacterium]|nr:class I SAM-dependent methyltransferase [Planctomycetota bacterium]